MPVLHRSEETSEYHIEARRQGRSIAYQLTVEGGRFLTEVLRLRPGDEFGADDLDFLIDRGWAQEADLHRAKSEPEPKLKPAAAEPLRISDPIPTETPEAPRSRAKPPEKKAEPPHPPLARRSRSREVALQVLYQQEQNPGTAPAEIERFIQRRLRDETLRAFAVELVQGVHTHQSQIDSLISTVAENWRLDRMAAIDRNILRLGAYEMLHGGDLPTKVAINEALELAKRFSTAQSSRFVNGILDRLLAAAASQAVELETDTMAEVSAEVEPTDTETPSP